jgi:hypothetical protein
MVFFVRPSAPGNKNQFNTPAMNKHVNMDPNVKYYTLPYVSAGA